MNETLTTILSLSVFGSVPALLLLLLKPLMKNRVSKTFYYYLWLIVLVRLCLPFGISLQVAVGWPIGETAGITEIQPDGSVLIGELSGNETGVNVAASYGSTSPNASVSLDASPNPAVAAGNGSPSGTGNVQNAAKTPVGILKNPDTWLLIWAAGALLSLSWHVFGYIRFTGIIKRTAV